METVKKSSNLECYTPSTEPLRICSYVRSLPSSYSYIQATSCRRVVLNALIATNLSRNFLPLMEPKVHSRVHKSPSLNSVKSQMISSHILILRSELIIITSISKVLRRLVQAIKYPTYGYSEVPIRITSRTPAILPEAFHGLPQFL
jgi:hypothetical protein